MPRSKGAVEVDGPAARSPEDLSPESSSPPAEGGGENESPAETRPPEEGAPDSEGEQISAEPLLLRARTSDADFVTVEQATPEGWRDDEELRFRRTESAVVDLSRAKAAVESGEFLLGTVRAIQEYGNEEGVILELEGNAPAFCPRTEWDQRLDFKQFARWMGAQVRVKVLHVEDGVAPMVFVSRRQAQNALSASLLPRLWESLEQGETPVVKGRVVGIGDNEVFIDIGGPVGMLPGRQIRRAPGEQLRRRQGQGDQGAGFLRPGDQVEVAVIGIKRLGQDFAQWSISLGVKAFQAAEWERAKAYLKPGGMVQVTFESKIPNVQPSKRGFRWDLACKADVPGARVDVLARIGRAQLSLEPGAQYRAFVAMIDDWQQIVRVVLSSRIWEA